VTGHYWHAAALDHYGPPRGLPTPTAHTAATGTSASHPDNTQITIYVGNDETYLRRHFSQVRKAAVVDNPSGIPVLNANVPVWICTGQHEPWSQLWPNYTTCSAPRCESSPGRPYHPPHPTDLNSHDPLSAHLATTEDPSTAGDRNVRTQPSHKQHAV
jgi:hypothetical protein